MRGMGRLNVIKEGFCELTPFFTTLMLEAPNDGAYWKFGRAEVEVCMMKPHQEGLKVTRGETDKVWVVGVVK